MLNQSGNTNGLKWPQALSSYPFRPVLTKYIGLYLELAWRRNDDLSVGLYFAFLTTEPRSLETYLTKRGSLLTMAVAVDRYWQFKEFRPFYSLSVGSFSHHNTQNIHTGLYQIGNGTYLLYLEQFMFIRQGYNVAPKIDLNYYRLRMQVMYQMITHRIPDITTLQLGIEIGGGREN
ncbi:hypothetical protein [Tunicatimonas pelagia]|uniref:hypothetical protein n=1 Tax=Tunicatimonas pelagia TaxID=931531 RepID=UPI0026652532|nr:hypothetical protein [Tunicatimonas pelagia]WKN44232.1 hypothetical protein P0M28_04535 [Tunicatimonas pelagia]